MLYLESELLIEVNCSSKISLPKKMYADSAGYDFFAHETRKVYAGSRTLTSTELRISIPKGFFGRISPCSGLAVNHEIVAFNGTIDSGYKGIIYVLLYSFSKDDYIVEKGNRIVQIIFQKKKMFLFWNIVLIFHLKEEQKVLAHLICNFFSLVKKKCIEKIFKNLNQQVNYIKN